MCSRSTLNEITDIVVDSYREVFGSDLVDVFLYGSYARGENSDGSDIDFAAIVKGDRLELQEKLKSVWSIAFEVGLEKDIIVSPVVIPYLEFEKYKAKLPYYRNIYLEGIKVG